MSYYPDFARLLNELLLQQDRSSLWLAKQLKVNSGKVSRWLNQGSRAGNPGMVAAYADVLGQTSKKAELLVAAGMKLRADE